IDSLREPSHPSPHVRRDSVALLVEDRLAVRVVLHANLTPIGQPLVGDLAPVIPSPQCFGVVHADVTDSAPQPIVLVSLDSSRRVTRFYQIARGIVHVLPRRPIAIDVPGKLPTVIVPPLFRSAVRI